MSKTKKKESAKKKEKPAKKKEDTAKKTDKKKSGSKKEETKEELEAQETMEAPAAPERLEAETEERATIEQEEAEETGEKATGKVGEEEAPVEAPVEEAAAVEEEPVEEEEEEEGLEIVEEKFYDLNLRRIWTAPRLKRTPRAVRYVKDFVSKRMKSDEVSMSEETNQLLWARGISKPPRHLRLRVVKDKDDRVIIFQAETVAGAPATPVEEPAEIESETAEPAAAPKAKSR